MRPWLVILAALALAACSRSHQDTSGADLRHAGQTARNDAARVTHSPEIRKAEADLKKVGHTAQQDFRKLAAEAKTSAHKLASDTRGAAHDATKHDRPEGHS